MGKVLLYIGGTLAAYVLAWCLGARGAHALWPGLHPAAVGAAGALAAMAAAMAMRAFTDRYAGWKDIVLMRMPPEVERIARKADYRGMPDAEAAGLAAAAVAAMASIVSAGLAVVLSVVWGAAALISAIFR